MDEIPSQYLTEHTEMGGMGGEGGGGEVWLNGAWGKGMLSEPDEGCPI